MDFEYINGRITRGRGIASGRGFDPNNSRITDSIRKQKPYFEGIVPEISEVFNGTINIDISPREFEILRPDYEVSCEWEKEIYEKFWFVRTILHHDNSLHVGLLYYPCPGYLKKHKNTIIEFLADWIVGIKIDDSVTIRYSPEQFRII